MLKRLCLNLLGSAKVWTCLYLLSAALPAISQQPATITGAVFSAENVPLAGVSVQVKGGATGTSTDETGKFSLQAQQNAVLVFSYIGYEPAERVITDPLQPLTVQLISSGDALGEVVVTALGIRKDSRTLTYATQQVSGQ